MAGVGVIAWTGWVLGTFWRNRGRMDRRPHAGASTSRCPRCSPRCSSRWPRTSATSSGACRGRHHLALPLARAASGWTFRGVAHRDRCDGGGNGRGGGLRWVTLHLDVIIGMAVANFARAVHPHRGRVPHGPPSAGHALARLRPRLGHGRDRGQRGSAPGGEYVAPWTNPYLSRRSPPRWSITRHGASWAPLGTVGMLVFVALRAAMGLA